MSTQSYNHRDTPLRRFNTFWWGLAYFGLFGVVSAVVVCWSGRSAGVEEVLKEQRLDSRATVDESQAAMLEEKELEKGKTMQVPPAKAFDRVGADLTKAPAASGVKVPTNAPDLGNAPKGKELYKAKNCATCHGPDGNTPLAPMYPKLGGKDAAYLLKQMQDIKSGARNTPLSPMMKPFITQVTDEEMKDIAAWIAGGSK
ncbi:hypothetical protein NT6N_28600 [Oceaniferula spumae]|uniref:Cytochrome c domain-containing protein n=1 Tax=Oceaniferula spumae TaxID=2979115 RepID=A0AAT9FPE2_9BACT